MKEKRKSTFNAKVLTALLIILFVGSCAVLIFAICTGQLSRENNNDLPIDTTAAAETTSATETTAQPVTTEPVSATVATTATEAVASDVSLGTSYDVDYWAEYKAEHGSAGLEVLFGARTQGAVVTFEGDRFTVSNINYDEYLSVATGTYSFISDTEIELRYDNSYIATAAVVETENGIVTAMDLPLDIEGTTLRISLAD